MGAGTLGALLGLGGGLFLVPALTLLFGLPIHTAVGTSLIGVIATSAGVSSVARPGRAPDVELALRLELASTAGALLGGLLAGRLSGQVLALLFAGMVFGTAIYTFRKTRPPGEPATAALTNTSLETGYQPRRWPAGLALMLLGGTFSGLTGSGGGFIKAPVMYSIMDVPLGVAIPTSNFMVGITAAASALVYYGRGDILPLVAAPTALGVFGGARLGVLLVTRLRADAAQGFDRPARVGCHPDGLERADRKLRAPVSPVRVVRFVARAWRCPPWSSWQVGWLALHCPPKPGTRDASSLARRPCRWGVWSIRASCSPRWGALSAGLLLLAALPAATVLLILARHLADRRWGDALAAAGIIGVLALSTLIGR